jgi:hypothetical protein
MSTSIVKPNSLPSLNFPNLRFCLIKITSRKKIFGKKNFNYNAMLQ